MSAERRKEITVEILKLKKIPQTTKVKTQIQKLQQRLDDDVA